MTTKPRKLVGVISFMNAAGAQEALLRLARQMRARGHDMEVWFLYEEDSIHADEPGIRILVRKPKLSPLEYVSVFFRLCGDLRKAKPDAVVGFLPLGNVFGLLAAAIAGVPLRVASQRAPGNTFGKVMRIADKILGASPVYERIICVSNAVKASFAGYPEAYKRKLSVVHNGIEWTPSPLDKKAAREALGLPADKFLFAAIGRMKAQKNYAFLLNAFARTREGVLVIAGDGALQPSLVAQAAELGVSDRIIFLGALGRAAVRNLLAAADAFVQSSLYEGQSNAVLEAMHQGLPIIVSDIPEQRETVADEDTGEVGALLPPLGEIDAWTQALDSVAADQALRAQLSTTAQAIVVRKFTLTRMIDGFEAVLAPPTKAE